MTQKVTPWLWFDTEAENAANDYVRIFSGRPGARPGDSKINEISRFGEAGPREAGMVVTVTFTLAGQEFAGLNGGPEFQFDEAVSLMVDCKDQAEVDYFWDALLENGGKESQCGWLKDRYGFSWQIVPEAFGRLMSDPDPERARRATEAMLKMVKLDVAELERAADAS
ncbi:MAG TPA: VOC family protein [Actinomycetota bacterium]|jgi:predicted 3-demethylubiquinone-9 3-methyltransferase (glyoxalase superfamily)